MTNYTMPDPEALRVWVGCLGCYNDGRLLGNWVNGLEAGDISKAVKVTTGAPAIYGANCLVCVVCGSDEFDVFDAEGYGFSFSTGSPHEAQRIAEAIEAIDNDNAVDNEAVFAFACDRHLDLTKWEEWQDDFADSFRGIFDSFRDMADDDADEQMRNYAKDSGIEWVQRYFDYSAYAADIVHDFNVVEVPSGVAVFYA